MWKLVLVGVLVGGGVAAAEPTSRFGLTFGFDRAAPGPELGPAAALGWRLGAFVGEVEYAYLSFFDAETVGAGIQRVGLSVRADLSHTRHECLHYACTRATTFYGEAGADERFGQWIVDATHVTPASSPQPGAHLGFGLELDNQLVPYRNGWQLGVRFELSPHGAALGTSCRGSGCTSSAPAGSGVDEALFLEWMFVLGG